MNLEDMIPLLQVHLGDPDQKHFTEPICLMLLNMAQDNAVQALRPDLTPELHRSALTQSLGADGAFAYKTALSAYPPMLNDRGIIGVRLTGGKFCWRISFREHMEAINAGRSFGVSDPVFYGYGANIYVEPYTDQTIDIYYRRRPVQMSFGVAVATNLLLTQYGTPSNTQFYGNDGQSLSEDDDTYNDSVIHCVDTDSNHVVTDYTASTRLFTVSPALGGTSKFLTGYAFNFLTHEFDSLYTECELDQNLHDTIVLLAAGLGYQQPVAELSTPSENARRRAKAEEFLSAGYGEIERLNRQHLATDSIGQSRNADIETGEFRVTLDSSGL